MSDFLQFVDRIPTLPNRKKLTFENDGSVKYATVEYADEPAEEGTFLNKANFNRLNLVLGYNEVTGQYNPTTETAEFTLDVLNEEEIVNNQRILLQPANQVLAPADDFDIFKNTTSLGTQYFKVKSISLSNGNTIFCGSSYNSTQSLYYSVIDKDGNIIKSTTSILSYSDCDMIELSNGNVLIVASNGTNGVGKGIIIDKDGNIVISQTTIPNTYLSPCLIELNNGNIMIISYGGYSAYTGYFSIISTSLETIKSLTTINNGYMYAKGIKMTNGNVMIFGHQNSGNSRISIYNQDGTIVESNISLNNNFDNAKMIQLSNGNIFIAGPYRYCIVSKDGDIEKSAQNLYYLFNTQIIETSEHKIIVVGDYDNSGNTGNLRFYAILDLNGNIIKEVTSLYTGQDNKILKMTNGNIIVSGVNVLNNRASVCIFDNNGNILKHDENVGNTSIGFLESPSISISENSNGYIVILCCKGSSSTYTGYYIILSPKSIGGTATLNGIEIDTILLKDKYYELIYNESQNKFIAEEVRNAN